MPAPAQQGAQLPAPDPAALARSRSLSAHLGDCIDRAGGWLPFDAFMAEALYAPGLGYYDGAQAKFGPDGDFTTAPELSPLFGAAIAEQCVEIFAAHGLPARLLEFGAGSGALAADVLAQLQRRGVAVQAYEILEVSADLRARQRERLDGLPVRWLDQLPASFEGVVIANEVLDVIPVRLFRRGEAAVQERGVVRAGADSADNSACGEAPALAGAGHGPAASGPDFAWALRPAAPDLAQAVAAIESGVGMLPPDFGSEWSPQAAAWVTTLGEWLTRGVALLIDYGFPRHEYYHPQRTMGTLMCHYRQHAHADPLWLPGLNDITAHVDFSACAAAAQSAGLDCLGYTSQAHFLLNCGLIDLLARDNSPAACTAVQRLVSEAEMGELFKVLALGRGVPDALRGFARGDRRHRL
jgi:SAM-dependent MidA family methyltransferase